MQTSTTVGGLQTPGLEDLDQYADMLIVVTMIVLLEQMYAKTRGSISELSVLVGLGRSGRLQGRLLP